MADPEGGRPDPLYRLKVIVGYVVVGVWAVLFIGAVFEPPRDEILYISVQAAMTIVAGGLFAGRIWFRKRNGDND